jgi:hypothetical protein
MVVPPKQLSFQMVRLTVSPGEIRGCACGYYVRIFLRVAKPNRDCDGDDSPVLAASRVPRRPRLAVCSILDDGTVIARDRRALHRRSYGEAQCRTLVGLLPDDGACVATTGGGCDHNHRRISAGGSDRGGKSGLTATVNLAEFESLWSVRSVRYDFSGPEPVPEPGTTLMVGFGTAAIVGRLSGRHCGSSQPSGTA